MNELAEAAHSASCGFLLITEGEPFLIELLTESVPANLFQTLQAKGDAENPKSVRLCPYRPHWQVTRHVLSSMTDVLWVAWLLASGIKGLRFLSASET